MAKYKPRRYIIFFLFRLLVFFVSLLPLRFGLKIGQYLGNIAFYLLKREREKALSNLTAAFGDSGSSRKRRIIAKQVFENMGKNLVEVISLCGFNREKMDRYVKCRGLEIVDAIIRKGGGAIMLSAHFGNWELMAHYFAVKGYPVRVVARRVRMEQFENFLAAMRKRHGITILYRDAPAKEVIALLKNDGFIGIMPDQDMDSVSGVFVEFFGRPAWTPNGPAVMNLLTGAPVVPCFIIRKDFGHEIVIGEPIELSATGNRDTDILENTKRYTKAIEDQIRKFPSQWVWFHDRWKTRP